METPTTEQAMPAIRIANDRLVLLGVRNATVYWTENNGRAIGYVSEDGEAMTAHVVFVNGRPKPLGFERGWPVEFPADVAA